eukprot:CAMPEP_0175076244 /NCGR_PEP_ID=MMETSP0052_2-20121109/22590_1 /TAXON_ID=51329 ORGANISM="Polytomella parva, Strain SAG 63-3" /NCGR_SAMPLE_ID=MMETSP0052_2 /ASSEMBLY_ACC=CAM_ASM_000194 /LENGTH=114 /DNA_ID=CAMNT_0016345303 /DNA_START=54 /DNA_END=395 /DNA_ORIENTATION=-
MTIGAIGNNRDAENLANANEGVNSGWDRVEGGGGNNNRNNNSGGGGNNNNGGGNNNKSGGGSIINVKEAELAVEMYVSLRELFPEFQGKVAVLAPYRAQVEFIRRLFRRHPKYR